MDTKERTRRRQTGNRRKSNRRPAAGTSAQGQRRRTTSEASRRREKAVRTQDRSRRKRTVRPPKEEIPEVKYTMPKPFRRGRFLLKLVTMAAVVGAVLMCISLFFRVETVMVAGAQTYTPWQVRQASGISEGDSLLGLSRGAAAGRIRSQLPYVDQVKISIELPGTVNIEITELDIAYAIEANDGVWWLISAQGRVIEKAEDAAGYTQILGVLADSPRQDSTVTAASQLPASDETETLGEGEEPTAETIEAEDAAQRLETALSILQCLEDNGITGEVKTVDVSDLSNISMNYEDRLVVLLGDSSNMTRKISYVTGAAAQLDSDLTGELDVSFRYSESAIVTRDS